MAAEYNTIEIKYAGLQVGQLTPDELATVVSVLLGKINVITGWSIPDNHLNTIIEDQFGKKLLEDYPNINREEIEAAFRKFGTQVKNWGKSFNLALFDEVLAPYMAYRAELSKVEEQVRTKPVEISAPHMSDQEILDMAWNIWQSTKKFQYLSANVYDIMVKHTLIFLSTDEKKSCMAAANSALLLMDEQWLRTIDRISVQKSWAKKLAVAEKFNKLMAPIIINPIPSNEGPY